MSEPARSNGSAPPTPAPYSDPTAHSSAAARSTPLQAAAAAAVSPDECLTSAEEPLIRPQGPGGRWFGKYELLGELARGGMGVVYRARDSVLGRIVALKMIRPEVPASSAELVRFSREARAEARLSHPHIVPVYDVGEHQGQCYFTMKLVEGGSLSQHRDRFTADPRAAVALVEKVARAVQCAHDAGILHRDLKPSNILLDENGEPLVADFGLAKVLDASAELTQTGQVLGTPAYMAPEQAAGRTGEISARTDVWALGVILYELLTGRRPFPGQGRDQVISQILTTEPAPPRQLRRQLDPALEAVILKCLEKDPAQRYTTAQALADDLGRWLRGEPPLAQPRAWPIRLARAARRQPTVILGLAFTLALAVLAVLAFRDRSGERPIAVGSELTPEQQQAREEALRPIQQQLAEGKTASLIGPTGEPPWRYRLLTEGPVMEAVVPREGVFAVDAFQGCCLIELMPAVRAERYRFRAEVQHPRCQPLNPGEQVGVYLAHSRHPTGRGTIHSLLSLTFSENIIRNARVNQPSSKADQEERPDPKGEEPKNSEVKLQMRLCWQELSGRVHDHYTNIPVADKPLAFRAAGPAPQRPWRRLAVEVRPEQIAVFWEGARVGAVDRTASPDKLTVGAEFLPRWCPDPSRVQPTFPPGGGLGLYIREAGARFRSVAIEPLR
ncbi:MAG TPA: serine/threonine-protein kinase [Gemmataceae bacterium]|nr:serine/threonine-protein kinase [Gemmataceae bacterium]